LLHRESLVEAYKLGVGMKGEDDDNDDSVGAAIQRGLEYMQRQDFRSDWKVEKTKPDINAVVTVVLDGSGSTAPYLKLLRGMVFDLRMLMKANYPRVRFEFVMFSGDARRFKEEEEEEFWQSFPGGGTNYQAGWETALSTLDKEYPRANWDRYLVTAGDFEDFGDVRKVGAFYDKILDEIEFHANVMVGARGQPDLWKWVLDRSRRDERVGSVDLTGRAAATIGDFRKLLKNPEN
jgi:uncharacterized sporulation protein YeaH/YhbH (DUF444 family)